MSMKFDFRTKLLVIVLTMSLVAVLTSDILIYTLFGVTKLSWGFPNFNGVCPWGLI